VHGRLRVAILSTGNELIEPGATELALGQVFDSNRAMVKSLLARLPVSVSDLGILPDDPQRIEATLIDAANGHDVLLTTGGASRGEEDHIIPALDRLGRRHLWQIAVKPGRPMTFGQIAARDHDCVFVGLPGNPVAAFVCFLLYVRPALALLGGGPAIAPPRFRVPAGFAIARRKTGRREFLRAWLEAGADGTLHAVKFPRDGSGLVSGLCAATGLIELPEDIEAIAPGDLVSFLPFEAF
jgi:molybdopterin molybdotransferase